MDTVNYMYYLILRLSVSYILLQAFKVPVLSGSMAFPQAVPVAGLRCRRSPVLVTEPLLLPPPLLAGPA